VGCLDGQQQRRPHQGHGHPHPKCHSFKDGGEVCEWSVPQQDGRQDLIGLTFNAKGQACQWSYRGFYGMQKSKQSC
jgi:hypothetical protein